MYELLCSKAKFSRRYEIALKYDIIVYTVRKLLGLKKKQTLQNFVK